jgi:hypothetical protein
MKTFDFMQQRLAAIFRKPMAEQKLQDFLNKQLKWLPIPESETDFFCDIYSKDLCYLRMNHFPDEPLWTLFYGSQSIDFDDTPISWNIKYRNDLD